MSLKDYYKISLFEWKRIIENLELLYFPFQPIISKEDNKKIIEDYIRLNGIKTIHDWVFAPDVQVFSLMPARIKSKIKDKVTRRHALLLPSNK